MEANALPPLPPVPPAVSVFPCRPPLMLAECAGFAVLRLVLLAYEMLRFSPARLAPLLLRSGLIVELLGLELIFRAAESKKADVDFLMADFLNKRQAFSFLFHHNLKHARSTHRR